MAWLRLAGYGLTPICVSDQLQNDFDQSRLAEPRRPQPRVRLHRLGHGQAPVQAGNLAGTLDLVFPANIGSVGTCNKVVEVGKGCRRRR